MPRSSFLVRFLAAAVDFKCPTPQLSMSARGGCYVNHSFSDSVMAQGWELNLAPPGDLGESISASRR